MRAASGPAGGLCARGGGVLRFLVSFPLIAAALPSIVIAMPVQANSDNRLVGAWRGSVDAVAIRTDGPQTLAYVGSGVRLLILDVTDPGNIVELSSVLLEGVVRGIHVRDDYAYIAAGREGYLCIVDISDPCAPMVVSMGGDSTYQQGYVVVTLHGDRAYTLFDGRIQPDCWDVSGPADPIRTSYCSYGGTNDVLVVGDYMYKAGDTGDVAVYDISDHFGSGYPPVVGLASIADLDGTVSRSIAIALDGHYAYVTDYKTGGDPWIPRIFVVDFSDLAARFTRAARAAIRAKTGSPGRPGLRFPGGRLHVADEYFDAIVFDVSDGQVLPTAWHCRDRCRSHSGLRTHITSGFDSEGRPTRPDTGVLLILPFDPLRFAAVAGTVSFTMDACDGQLGTANAR